MTDAELLTSIDADPTAKALADAGNDSGCAERLSAVLPRVPVPGVFVNERTILKAFSDPTQADAVLSVFEAAASSNPVFARVLKLLPPSEGGVEFGLANTRTAIDMIAASAPTVFTPEVVATLKGLAEVPVSVSADDVSRVYAVNRPDGKVSNGS